MSLSLSKIERIVKTVTKIKIAKIVKMFKNCQNGQRERSAGGKMTGFSKIIGKTCKKCENAYFLNGDIQSSLLTGHMT